VSASDINEVFEGVVRGISGEGHGVIESPSKKIYFVAGSWPGDHVRVRVTESTSRYGYGRIEEILSPSPDRVDPVCKHQGWGEGKCGGCPWMIGSYESQLKHKEHRLHHSLERIHLIDEKTKFHPIKAATNPFGYRNRAQLKSDGKKIGFMAVGTKDIVDVEKCPILSAKNQESLTALRSRLPNPDWVPPKGHTFVKLEINEETDLKALQPNQRMTFQQANDQQNSFMKEWAESWMQKWKAEGRMGKAGLELFCGSGNFSKSILKNYTEKSEKLYAVEWKGEALEKLKSEKLKNLAIAEKDLFRTGIWGELIHWVDESGTNIEDLKFLFLDPPRDGLKNRQGLLDEFSGIETVLYVSCDLATLSRDLQHFREKGFRLLEVQGVDQFPNTSHLEVLCALAR
jgi:23S rRNA (uracil1939-C5)-methyltransferase